MEAIAVDWSGAMTGAASRIWIARATGGVLTALEAPGSRDAVQTWLRERRQDAAPCVVGLDFAFGLPAWFAAERGWNAITSVWSAARDEGESWLRDCPPPFWGKPGVPRSHAVERGLRASEQAWATVHRPKSVFQVGGAGSVGTGSIRGMPMLLALRDTGWSVWPFDPLGTHTLMEIYPRLFTGPVVKRHAGDRAAHLARAHPAIEARFTERMIASEDAFDAGVSAIIMSGATPTLAPRPVASELALIEGAIWVPGAT